MNRDLLLKLVFGGDATGATKAANDSTAAVNRLGAAIKSVPAVSPAARAFDTLPPKADQATKAVKLTAQQLTNMQFQLQDIGVGLVSGQSPFTVMMQQGSQLAQSFTAGTGVRGALKAVGEGLKSFITNPLNLAVVGFGLALTAATSFFSYMMQDGSDTKQLLDDHEKLIKRIGEAFDGATGKVKEFSKWTRASLLFNSTETLKDLEKVLQKKVFDFGFSMQEVGTGQPTINGVQRKEMELTGNSEFLKTFDEFRRGIRDGTADVKGFVDAISTIANVTDDPRIDRLAARLLAGVSNEKDNDGVLDIEHAVKQQQLAISGLKGDREDINKLLGRGGGEAEAEQKRLQRMSERWAQIMREEAGALDLLTDKQRQNTYETVRAAKEQELLNKAHQVYGETLAPNVVKWINEEAAAYARKAAAIAYSQNAREMDMDLVKQEVASMDSLRNTTSSITQEFFRSKAAGASWGEALMGVVDKLTDSFVGLLDKMIQAAAFGEEGTAGGGLLGGLAKSAINFLNPSPSLYAMEFASGAAFTNGIYSKPTMFSHGRGKLGVMAEKGPEAVMPLLFGRGGLSVGASTGRGETSLPLTRLSGGKLGVKAYADGDVFGSGAGLPSAANQNGGPGGLTINQTTHNYSSGAQTKTRVKENGRGGIDIETFVTDIVDRHAARGGLDGTLGSRFNLNKKLNSYG